MATNPMHQFNVYKIGPEIKINGIDLSFTNASLFMLISAISISIFLLLGTKDKKIIPGKFQLLSEILYNFISKMISATAGKKAKPFFPFIFSNHITSLFSNDQTVIEYGGKYLQISAFVLTAYPIFFLSNGCFMALKKSEYAMISNFFRNVLNPVLVFYFASLYNASFEQFFWIWVVINWIFSITYFLFTFNYLRSRLQETRAIVNP